MTHKTRIAMIGCGGMARYHIREIMKQADGSQIAVMCEPSEAAYAASAQLYLDAGQQPPPNQPDLARVLADYPLDAAFIITPHVLHHDQTVACLEAGLDVLLEKPMVMNGAEAESLIAVQERTGRLLVVAFPGSLSPRIRKAVEMLRSGELGRLLSISATVWQDWGPNTVGYLAAGSRAGRRRLPLRHRRAHAQHRGRPGRRGVRRGRGLAGRQWPAGGDRGHGHGPAALRRLGDHARLRRGDPLVRQRRARLLLARPSCAPASGASGWTSSAPGRSNCGRSRCRRPPASGSSSWPCAAVRSPTPARPRWACAWPGCTTRSRRRPRRVGSRCVLP